jgi:hypothetical protein
VRNLGFSNGDPREMRDTANSGGVDGHLYRPLRREIESAYSRGPFRTATAGVSILGG